MKPTHAPPPEPAPVEDPNLHRSRRRWRIALLVWALTFAILLGVEVLGFLWKALRPQ